MHAHRLSLARISALASVAIATVLLAGCSAAAPTTLPVVPEKPVVHAGVVTSAHVTVLANQQFGSADGKPLLLDVCLPAATSPVNARPAIIAVHGGSWAAGDKSSTAWRGVCEWLAENGYVGASVDYRLSPASVFPAAIDDLGTAVRWLRAPVQAKRFAIDPTLIGAYGGSAGGNLVSLLGTRGTGPLDRGSRVAAVVELSGPENLTRQGAEQTLFYPFELRYLGCSSFRNCPQAKLASPVFQVNRTDPPFFVAQSTKERIPLSQSDEFVAALRAAGVETTYVTRPGNLHSVAMLDGVLRERILAFLRVTLTH
jgi:acetyl esterase/lipase